MSRRVNFVDTSILCNLIPVPGRDQDRSEVLKEQKAKIETKEAFILPVTTIIETGNHIKQINNGSLRRAAANTFVEVLKMVHDESAPWRLHEFVWGTNLLDLLIKGARTGTNFVDHSVGGLGGGDLCILCEREIYMERTGIENVFVWAKDHELESHC
ncbi:hypothetical protein OG943_41010 [Amycolatopsis sp. NBC_00345]|uniref:hypothetical protein n=1 Tax=Amycolatopsis sp. NBC_00345 TaxID=2975955 RepID=UPI002E26A285